MIGWFTLVCGVASIIMLCFTVAFLIYDHRRTKQWQLDFQKEEAHLDMLVAQQKNREDLYLKLSDCEKEYNETLKIEELKRELGIHD